MDLFCPHCTKRVTVSDDKAGLIVNCPLCMKQFVTPSLPSPMAPAPKPPPPEPSKQPAPAPAPAPAPHKVTMSIFPEEPAAPPPPGDYSRTYLFYLTGEWLAFVPVACLVLVLVTSFFGWHQKTDKLSLWQLAFSDFDATFITYAILLTFSTLMTIASLIFEKKWIAAPPTLAGFLRWKDLIVGLFLSVGFGLLAYDYIQAHFQAAANPILLAMKIAVRLHFWAIVACFLQFWLHWRQIKNVPPPKWEMKL